jgi:membrane associated rhomboid family serine protease
MANAGRLKQIRMVAGLVNRSNPRAMPIVFGSGLGIVAVMVVVGLLTGLAPLLIPLGVIAGLLVAMILFGRFAQAAQYSAIEGSPARRPRCWRTCAATGR